MAEINDKLKKLDINETNDLLINNLNADKLTTLQDVADLEYDEDYACLVAEQDSKFGNGQFSPDNLIDEDYEAELCANQNFTSSEIESEKRSNQLKERIDRYGIVNVCGTDKMGRSIIVISACKLPDAQVLSREKDYFQDQPHFFQVLQDVISTTLEKYVESEYTLVYLHYGLKSTSQPSFNWLAKVYKMLDRKFKKNLKALYIVHPTILIKLMSHFLRPLISSKFNKKVFYCNTLSDLANFIELDILKIPNEVKYYDIQLKLKKSTLSPSASNVSTSQEQNYGPFQQFKVSLECIAKNNNGDCTPLCVKEAIVFLRQNLDEEGIFRKSGSLERIREIQSLYNQGQPVAYDNHEVHVAACVLKAFFRELPESLISEAIFNEIMSLQALDVADKVEVSRDLLHAKLPKYNYDLLKYIIEFLSEVAQNSSKNRMDAKNISYVFGPNFLRPREGVDYGLIDVEKINYFVELLIKYHSDIFNNSN